MSRSLQRIYDDAQVHLPGAVKAAIQLELFNALQTFLKHSDLWQEDISVTVAAGQTNYYVVPAVGLVNRLIYVTNADGTPYNAAMEIPGELTFATEPTPGTYTARVALTVDDPTTRDGDPFVPEWILDKYRDGLASEVLARMMVHPAKPYTNPQLAVIHHRNFKNALAEAMTEAKRKNVKGAQTWRFPRGFA